jgi:glutamate N-acetyltransferase / amino-acid N-acetyltransferase
VSVTFPRGFLASGITAGFKASGRPDFGLLVSEGDAAVAGAFTTNAFPAAPVQLDRRRVEGGVARAVVVNSGQANAGTGDAGLEDASSMAVMTGSALEVDPAAVLVCSTGVIGPRIPLELVDTALPKAAAGVRNDGGDDFAEAILTTDRRAKQAQTTAGTWRVGGCAKGAGMIGPRLATHGLATLLVFLTTDAPASAAALREIVRDFAAPVWNGVTVDACPSTNDTVLLLANGAGGGPAVEAGTAEARTLGETVGAACDDLARQVVADAEGSSKTLVVQVNGASDRESARSVGLAVASSPLVKTALFGGDPNPGRFLQAIGASGVPFDASAVTAWLGDVAVVDRGTVPDPVPSAAADAMAAREVVLRIDLNGGPGAATVFGCDLSHDYVDINSRYTT